MTFPKKISISMSERSESSKDLSQINMKRDTSKKVLLQQNLFNFASKLHLKKRNKSTTIFADEDYANPFLA